MESSKRMRASMGEVVCDICGSGSSRPLIAKCVECNSYQHRYCMPVVAYSIPSEWLCSECQEKANGDQRPNQGGPNELQSACGTTRENETPKLDLGHSNVVHQISPCTRKGFLSAKVKFISSEEVVSLNKDRRPYGRLNSAVRRNQILSMSPPSLRQYSYVKCTSPTRSDTQMLALDQCTAASHGHEEIENRSDVNARKSQVRHASLPILKQLSSMKCVSPSRNGTQVHSPLIRSVPVSHDKVNIENGSAFATQKSQVPHATPSNVEQTPNWNCISPSSRDTQVYALKRCVTASHEARKNESSMNRNTGQGSSMPMTNRCRTVVAESADKGDIQVEDKTKENNIVSADKEKITSQVHHERREEVALCVSESKLQYWHGADHGFKWGESRRPSSTNCWTGCFHVLYDGTMHNLGELKAYFPSKMLPKIHDIASAMPTTLQLEMLPRFDDWPRTFESSRPTHEDIGLFFFSTKYDCHEKKHSDLLETSCNYVMRAYIDDIKLLIYSSEVLPPDSQCGERQVLHYLKPYICMYFGVFYHDVIRGFD